MPLQEFAPATTAIPTGIHEGILFGILLVAGANSCNGQLADWKYYCRGRIASAPKKSDFFRLGRMQYAPDERNLPLDGPPQSEIELSLPPAAGGDDKEVFSTCSQEATLTILN